MQSAPILSSVFFCCRASCDYEWVEAAAFLQLAKDRHTHIVIMMMRIYALYNRSRRVLAFFVGVAVGVLVVGCVRSPTWPCCLWMIQTPIQWLLVSSKSKHQPIDEVALVGCPAPLSRPEYGPLPSLKAVLTFMTNYLELWVCIPFEPLLRASDCYMLGLGLGWGGILVLDSLVFALTVYKTWSLRKRSGVSLIHLLLRDGKL